MSSLLRWKILFGVAMTLFAVTLIGWVRQSGAKVRVTPRATANQSISLFENPIDGPAVFVHQLARDSEYLSDEDRGLMDLITPRSQVLTNIYRIAVVRSMGVPGSSASYLFRVKNAGARVELARSGFAEVTVCIDGVPVHVLAAEEEHAKSRPNRQASSGLRFTTLHDAPVGYEIVNVDGGLMVMRSLAEALAFPSAHREARTAVVAALEKTGGEARDYFAEVRRLESGHLRITLRYAAHARQNSNLRGDACGRCRRTSFDPTSGEVAVFERIQ